MSFYSTNKVHPINTYPHTSTKGEGHRHHQLLQEEQSSDEDGVLVGTNVDLLEAALQQKLRKRDILLQKIKTVCSERRRLYQQSKAVENFRLLWTHRYNAAVKDRTRALSSYLLQQTRLGELKDTHEKLKQIYVLQDVFHIWHRGPYITINGLRLGMADCSAIISSSSNPSGALEQQTNSFWNNNHVIGSPIVENNVPWHEVNASLGMMALLMHTLQKHLRIFYPRYMVHPRGSTTKVLSRKTKQEWDLFHQPTAFQFFARRNWNAALNIMGYILVEIINEVNRVMRNDKVVQGEDCAIPFPVTLEGDWGNERIGTVQICGLDIAFHGDAVEWTKAMRYMAINLKMIVALVAKCSLY
jgi:beclin 1